MHGSKQIKGLWWRNMLTGCVSYWIWLPVADESMTMRRLMEMRLGVEMNELYGGHRDISLVLLVLLCCFFTASGLHDGLNNL